MPSPAAPAYLTVTYASKPQQRGGTLIAEDVRDLGVLPASLHESG
jgi:hypothetical protein